MSASTFRSILARFHHSALTFSACAHNAHAIALPLRNAAADVGQERAWNDILTRSKAALHHGQDLDRYVRDAYELAGGDSADLPAFKRIRVAQPLTFSAALCTECELLEQSFSPTDAEQRTTTTPWNDQYVTIFNDLTSLIYRGTAVSAYFDGEVSTIRDTMTTGNDALAIKRWDADVVERSLLMLTFGRNCFADSEVDGRQSFEQKPPSRRYELEITTRQKYAANDASSLKAVGGLYAINIELLCPTCKLLVEELPFAWGTS